MVYSSRKPFLLLGGSVLVGLTLVLTSCTVVSQVFNPSSVSRTPAAPAGTVAVIDSDLIISQPVSNERVSSLLAVAGRAARGINTVTIRLRDDAGQLLATSSAAVVSSNGGWGVYSAELTFGPAFTQSGVLEVYHQDQTSNLQQNLITLPLVFTDVSPPTVKVFFSNSQKDPEFLNCDVVYPVKRTASSTKELVLTALSALINGPTDEEIADGFVTSLPELGIAVQSLDLSAGVFNVDFNEALEQGVAGSCRVQAIRAQITETLRQFSGVDEVMISINGRTEDILQP